MDEQAACGLDLRRLVMGDAFVDRVLENVSPFTQPLQDHINREAWGTVWQRNGLDLKTRSMVTVSMLCALGRTAELKGHIQGALNNGVSVAELQEILLHSTIYCGVPVAAEAFRVARELIEA